jgi:imidazolonepropionase-like amidohydrolase
MRSIFSLIIFAFLAQGILAQGGNLLIKNGTVLTVTKGTFAETDVLVQNGKISKIGKNLSAPANTATVDATGQFVMPGIIDAHSHLALDGINEATNPVTAEVWTGDALNPFDIGIYRALAGGITAAHAMHGSANAIGGQCETIKMRYGTYNPNELRMEGAPRTIKFALGENPMRVHGEGRNIMPRSRMGVEQVFRNAFSEAREYMAAQEKYEAAKRSNPNAVPPKYNRRMETLADILKGNIIIHCHSYRADEIVMLMNVCKDFGIERLCFQHVNEGFKVAPELADFGAGASVFADWWAYKFEVYYSTAYNAAILTRNGVVASINSDDAELIRHLYHEAGKTQRYGGLTDDEALALITINPAKQLGIAERTGSLEEGKDADIAIFNAHPLSIYAIPQMTIVDGVIRFDIKNDPDDMRLDVDPQEEIQPVYLYHEEEEVDNCMEGVFEQLFLNGNK